MDYKRVYNKVYNSVPYSQGGSSFFGEINVIDRKYFETDTIQSVV